MFITVPLRAARIRSSLYCVLKFYMSLYVNLVYFDRISSKDNLLEKSGALRHAFSCAKKSARQTSARMKSLTGKTLKHGNNVLLWLRIKVVSRESNSTAELTLMWLYVALYIEALAPELQLQKQIVETFLSSTIKNRHIAQP